MPGLKQAGIISHQRLTKYLELAECKPFMHSPSLCKLATLPISSTLVTDDLDEKFIETKSAQCLIDSSRKKHELPTDCTGENYLGMDITWS